LRFPIRSCIACRKKENWNDLLRLVLIDGQVIPDPDQNRPGRGGWMHRKCFDVAVQRRAFGRAFKSSDDVKVEALENYLKLLKEQ